ncbi:MAG: hypothetical protein BJ554DRAFT_3770 [Olpidium bornovanus]|uniref:Uncharacterized protein n=1 Tax=Olpidium bornovanus TaxID=278681 RepID=A0A8H8A156_9FUNG|nr:MAG: hypothetical protein BJ554DRAFT_3770 [Olpidium bornovanus]
MDQRMHGGNAAIENSLSTEAYSQAVRLSAEGAADLPDGRCWSLRNGIGNQSGITRRWRAEHVAWRGEGDDATRTLPQKPASASHAGQDLLPPRPPRPPRSPRLSETTLPKKAPRDHGRGQGGRPGGQGAATAAV